MVKRTKRKTIADVSRAESSVPVNMRRFDSKWAACHADIEPADSTLVTVGS